MNAKLKRIMNEANIALSNFRSQEDVDTLRPLRFRSESLRLALIRYNDVEDVCADLLNRANDLYQDCVITIEGGE